MKFFFLSFPLVLISLFWVLPHSSLHPHFLIPGDKKKLWKLYPITRFNDFEELSKRTSKLQLKRPSGIKDGCLVNISPLYHTIVHQSLTKCLGSQKYMFFQEDLINLKNQAQRFLKMLKKCLQTCQKFWHNFLSSVLPSKAEGLSRHTSK